MDLEWLIIGDPSQGFRNSAENRPSRSSRNGCSRRVALRGRFITSLPGDRRKTHAPALPCASLSVKSEVLGANCAVVLLPRAEDPNSSCACALSIRNRAFEATISLISKPSPWRPRRFAATSVVPLPANGSQTRSPGAVKSRTRASINASGFCVVWMRRSALQPWTIGTR